MSPPPSDPVADARRPVHYFVSFCRRDGALKDEFLERLENLFAPAKGIRFVGWQDRDIELGRRWHDEIQKAIQTCDFGLLLVSPAFLGNEYIGTHEIPRFLEPGKQIIPVALRALRFDGTMDLRGLEERQIFHDRNRKAYAELRSPQQKEAFVYALFDRLMPIVSRAGREASDEAGKRAADDELVAALTLSSRQSGELAGLQANAAQQDQGGTLTATANVVGRLEYKIDSLITLVAPKLEADTFGDRSNSQPNLPPHFTATFE